MPEKKSDIFYRKMNMGIFNKNEYLKKPDSNVLFWVLGFFNNNIEVKWVYVKLSIEEFHNFPLEKKFGNFSLFRMIQAISDQEKLGITFKETAISLKEFEATATAISKYPPGEKNMTTLTFVLGIDHQQYDFHDAPTYPGSNSWVVKIIYSDDEIFIKVNLEELNEVRTLISQNDLLIHLDSIFIGFDKSGNDSRFQLIKDFLDLKRFKSFVSKAIKANYADIT